VPAYGKWVEVAIEPDVFKIFYIVNTGLARGV
jgi:hypothetical protein